MGKLTYAPPCIYKYGTHYATIELRFFGLTKYLWSNTTYGSANF